MTKINSRKSYRDAFGVPGVETIEHTLIPYTGDGSMGPVAEQIIRYKQRWQPILINQRDTDLILIPFCIG